MAVSLFNYGHTAMEVIEEAHYKDSGVDLTTVLAAELRTRLPPELFIVWDNLPWATQCSYAEAKKHFWQLLA